MSEYIQRIFIFPYPFSVAHLLSSFKVAQDLMNIRHDKHQARFSIQRTQKSFFKAISLSIEFNLKCIQKRRDKKN